MKHIAKLAAIACVGLIVSGCSMSKGAIDEKPIDQTVMLDESLESVYYRLTTQAKKGTPCDRLIQADHYQSRKEFRVYYGGSNANGMGYNMSLEGRELTSGKTAVDIRRNMGLNHTPDLANFLRTGVCKG